MNYDILLLSLTIVCALTVGAYVYKKEFDAPPPPKPDIRYYHINFQMTSEEEQKAFKEFLKIMLDDDFKFPCTYNPGSNGKEFTEGLEKILDEKQNEINRNKTK